jgi:hypothetical protein
MRRLIAEGRIETTGDISKGWKEFDVKQPGAKQTDAVATAETSNG